MQFRAVTEKNVCSVSLLTTTGGHIDPSGSSQFNVDKGSTYQYDPNNKALTFSGVSGSGQATFYGVADDMYMFAN